MKNLLLFLICTFCSASLVFAQTGKIEARVWNDKNDNGLQDNNENGGIAGVTVGLIFADGTPIGADQVTGSNGKVTFENVPTDVDLKLIFKLLNDTNFDGYKFTRFKVGGGSNPDNSDAKVNSGETERFKVAAGSTQSGIDAGVWAPGTVTARVWNDTDGDGLQGNGENGGIGNVVVKLLDASNGDAELAENTTGANGQVTFTNVPADRNLRLMFVKPDFHKFTKFKVGGGSNPN
ncbi:MAG: SdrD B-like domain-containing protein, partial [Bacteroidota bacterium]